ncbi:hypothetical protein [Agromyces bauzanensis]|uniref:Uncharacterized protein n=1 Tax=Agromyces bauzanensis TaxID=1308924 RepID=A0A917PL04_9MICO|nr:hypothetical protein [Agromyces bauzanensis]GGJ82827.1 hypothetical protein GCM10011372_21380 [Agromyces bauzanensis]
MMGFSAAEDRLGPERAARLAAECADYAQRTGNVHELAHAHLVQAMLRTDAATARATEPGRRPGNATDAADRDDLLELTATFRRLGDLRCMTRCLLLRERLARPDERAELLEEAVGVAHAAGDLTNQVTALTRMVRAHRQRVDDSGPVSRDSGTRRLTRCSDDRRHEPHHGSLRVGVTRRTRPSAGLAERPGAGTVGHGAHLDELLAP